MFGLATVLLGYDLQGWITLIAGILLALITLFTGWLFPMTPAMSMLSAAPPSRLISRSEFLSSLPRWRRWLSRLNWHPVVDLEIRSIERKQRMKQLESEIAQLKNENARLAELNDKLDAILFSSDTNSNQAPSTLNNFET